MAEFSEVMHQITQMCESMPGCDACPLWSQDKHGEGICPFTWNEIPTVENFRQAEKIVIDWAMEYPFSPYPTWEEWRVTNFPDTSSVICPCHFMTTNEWYDISGCACEDCAVCRSKPIPAYIAKRLGIKSQGANT